MGFEMKMLPKCKKIVYTGPILESKDVCNFWVKVKKGENILNFRQKCTKFENILKKGSLVCSYHLHETARICYGTV